MNDLISRQAAIDLVVANHTELNGVNVVMYSPLCKDIKQLPSVTPQPKTRQRLCRTCVYGDKTEYDKPCIIYSDNCQLYKAKILDKIRAEIEQVSYTHYFEYGEYIGEDTRQERIVNFDTVMQIIDKYKAESEDEEGDRQ